MFWALFDMKREKGERAVKDVISHRILAADVNSLCSAAEHNHIIKDRFLHADEWAVKDTMRCAIRRVQIERI